MELFELKEDFFQGPLDLLLHLIRKNKFDIYNANLTRITSEYLGYLARRERIHPSQEGDYLLIAATLIYLKSRQLLGDNDQSREEKEELFQNILAYEEVQKISAVLREMEDQSLFFWKRQSPAAADFRRDEFYLEEISAFQLAEVFFAALKEFEKDPTRLISSRQHSLQEARAAILAALNSEGYLDFSFFLSRYDSLQSVVIHFFTLLELVKQGVVVAMQKRVFSKIEVFSREERYN